MQNRTSKIKRYFQGLLHHFFQLYQCLIFAIIFILAGIVPNVSFLEKPLSGTIIFLAKIGYIEAAYGMFPMFGNPFDKYPEDNITKLFNKHDPSDVDKFHNEKKAS